ncbi:MAG: TetR/AcrR family transcriptional regulator [Actinobacteria bacterium]|nr:TetR/AcrR family transcriptional regulator [Actinomycetota bacterium]
MTPTTGAAGRARTTPGHEAEPADNGRPLRADALRNRAKILEAAEEVLATEGLAAPIDDIARRAGVGIGTVYRHFPTKEALFEAIFVAWVQRLLDEARARIDAEDPGRAFFDELDSWFEHSVRHRAVAEGLADTGIDVRAATADLKQDLRDAIEQLLVRAQAAGAVRDDVQIGDVMLVTSGACTALNQSGLEPDERSRTFRIMCDGLRARR